jgi:hypothetical protein
VVVVLLTPPLWLNKHIVFVIGCLLFVWLGDFILSEVFKGLEVLFIIALATSSNFAPIGSIVLSLGGDMG